MRPPNSKTVMRRATVLLVGILTGIVPAFHDRRRDLASGLLSSSRSGTRDRSALRVTLLVLQVAMSVVLLVGAGLFVRSILTVRSLHLGYDIDRILFAEAEMRNEAPTLAELGALKHRLLERAQSLPSVAAASLVTTIPFYSTGSGPIFVPGVDTAAINRHGEYTRQYGSPNYFAAAGTRILRGRAFTASDRQGTPRVAVVTEAMGKALWPASDAIGQCFKIGADSMPANVPTIPASADIGPPAAPLAIAAIASRCCALARSSAMTPTVQLPLFIASGVIPSTMKPRPSRVTSSKRPCSMRNPIAKLHAPFVGRALICAGAQGHTKSQLQVS